MQYDSDDLQLMCLGKTLDHFKTFADQQIVDGSKLVLTIRKNKPSNAVLEAAKQKLGIKPVDYLAKPAEKVEIKAPNLKEIVQPAVNQQQTPSAMLVLQTQKKNDEDLARAIEESKFYAGLPNDLDMMDQQNEDEQLRKVLELSRIEAFEVVRQKSIEAKKHQVDKKETKKEIGP